ncbi:MAG TPA: nucleotidyltransferase domain-containing protein [Candidatus Wallbacteria bacterium]|nr:nucleotidyltransferase domain-containing protein [Candidatus Wallbacteria bacterium]
MDKKTIDAIIQQFHKCLESQGIRVSKLMLFGSCAAGDQKAGSDIDLVVISEDFEKKTYWERVDIISAAIYEVFQPIEATALTNAEWQSGEFFVCEYAKRGEIVYDAHGAP